MRLNVCTRCQADIVATPVKIPRLGVSVSIFSQFQSSLSANIKPLTGLTAMHAGHHKIQVAQ
jgi:hypothetical protein